MEMNEERGPKTQHGVLFNSITVLTDLTFRVQIFLHLPSQIGQGRCKGKPPHSLQV